MFDGFHAMKKDDVDVESVCDALRVECERSFRVDCDYVDEYWKEGFTVCDIDKMKKRYVDWLFSYEAKTKDGQDALNCPDDVYNTWIPWPCLKPVEATEDRLIFVLSRALKHFGAEGTGKSTWMKLLRKMFGEAFYSTTRPEETIDYYETKNYTRVLGTTNNPVAVKPRGDE